MPPTVRPDMSTGDRIAVWRVYRGMTQEACAGLVGKSLSYWKKIESGVRRVEKLSDLILIAQVLKVRALDDLTGVLEFSLALDRTREHPLLPAMRKAMVDAVDPLGPAARPDPTTPLADRMRDARRAFHTSPRSVIVVGEVLPGLIADSVRVLRRADDGPSRRAAATMTGEAYLLACQWFRHVANFELAMTAVDRAMACAHDANDPELIGLVAWQMSGTLKDLGRAEESLSVCRHGAEVLAPGLDRADDAHLAVWGHLQLQAALSAAHTADEGTALRLWDAGQAASSRLSDGYHHPVNLFDRRGMQAGMFAVHVHVALGKASKAIAASQRLDFDAIPSAPIRSRGLVDVARGYAARRDDVATLHVLRRAEAEHFDTAAHNVYVHDIVHEMMRRDRKMISNELHDFARRIGIFT